MGWFDDNSPNMAPVIPEGQEPSMGGSPPVVSGDPMDPAAIERFVAWLAQQPGTDPTLRNNPAYYAGKIRETGGLTPGNQSYWVDRGFKEGQIAAQGGAGGGELPGIDPSYDFRQKQGEQAIQRSAAARGTLLTGGTLKDLAEYGQGLASQEYQNIFNRNAALANLGYNAANAGANYASQYGREAGDLVTGQANANAAGSVAQGQNWGGLLGDLGELAMFYGLQPKRSRRSLVETAPVALD